MTRGRIVSYTYKTDKPGSLSGRFQESKAGDKVWLIEYEPGVYFYCAYELKVSAAKVKDNLTGSKEEIAANGTKEPEYTLYRSGEV